MLVHRRKNELQDLVSSEMSLQLLKQANELQEDLQLLKLLSRRIGKSGFDNKPPHTRDFSRELGGFS